MEAEDARRVVAAPFTVPWRGCVLHRIHLPRPVRTHRHHVFPLFLQERAAVERQRGVPTDQRTVDVCPTGHDDVHAALDALLAGAKTPKGVGRKELALAKDALYAYQRARGGRAGLSEPRH